MISPPINNFHDSLKELPLKIVENELAGFYVMNDKYAGTPNPEKLSEWLQQFLDTVDEKNLLGNENIFHNGGGPMEAQWNPNADLLFVAFFTNPIDTSTLVFKMNDFPILKNKVAITKRSKDGLTICWFVVPKNRYMVMLHIPSEKEIGEICVEKKLDRKDWIKNSCTVLKISVETKGQKKVMEKYFLASFGE